MHINELTFNELLESQILPHDWGHIDLSSYDYSKINSGSDITITRTYDEPNPFPTSTQRSNLEKNGIILYVILEDY